MAHYHHCAVCKIPVAMCGLDECQHDGKEFCTIHHPDPEFHQDPTPPAGRNINASSITVIHQK